MIDAAIVGLGWWGKVIVQSVQGRTGRLRFVRGVTKEPEDAHDLAGRAGIELSTEYEDALRDPKVQAVVLATPHGLHRAQVEAAAAAGKHVFCEKPLALSLRDAEAMLAACDKARVALGVGLNRRHWRPIAELKRMVGAGELGTLMHVEGNYSHDILADMPAGSWRVQPDQAPAGGMTGMGIHLVDAYAHLLGPIAEVYAQCVDRVLGRASGDTVSALLKFRSGATGYLGTTLKTPFIWRLQLFGSDAWAESRGESDLTVCRKAGETATRVFPPYDSVLAEMEAFADAIDGRAPFPIPPAEMLHTVAALEAIFRSVQSGKAERVR